MGVCRASCLQKLMDLADAAELKSKIKAMYAGEHINSTEDRAVLHVATRARREQVGAGGVGRSQLGCWLQSTLCSAHSLRAHSFCFAACGWLHASRAASSGCT